MKDIVEAIKLFINWADSRRIATIVILFCSLVSPGCLAFYHYRPELFQQLDTLKLLFIWTSLSIPFIILGAIITFTVVPLNLNDEKLAMKRWLFGATISGLLQHFSLFVAFNERIPTLRAYLIFSGVVHVVTLVAFAIFSRIHMWRESRKKRCAK